MRHDIHQPTFKNLARIAVPTINLINLKLSDISDIYIWNITFFIKLWILVNILSCFRIFILFYTSYFFTDFIELELKSGMSFLLSKVIFVFVALVPSCLSYQVSNRLCIDLEFLLIC